MQMKRYTIASLILMVLVWLFISNYIPQGGDKISIEFFGIHLPAFSIAVWVLIPLVVLYVASVAHFSFYAMLGSFKLRKYEKDYAKLVDSIVDAFLGKIGRQHNFQTERYKLLGTLLDNSTISADKDMRNLVEDKKINEVIELVEKVKEGYVVDLKRFSLKNENPLVEQNDRNRYKHKDIKAEEILSKDDTYSEAFAREVFSDFAKVAPLHAIENYKRFMNRDVLFSVLKRINSSENQLEISNESLRNLILEIDLNSFEFIEVSRILSKGMIPEQRIKLFDILAEKNIEAIEAQLYTLFDLEMLKPANEILQNSQVDEYLNFKSYSALKKHNQHFSIEIFVR